jgi:hypothetical protein
MIEEIFFCSACLLKMKAEKRTHTQNWDSYPKAKPMAAPMLALSVVSST